VFTLHMTVRGQEIKPTEHDSFTDMGDTLAAVLDDADMGLKPRTVSVLLALMFSDLRTRKTWRWIGEDYEIFVARDGP
jgi:hypothetical protein